jgi:hypothetical protein
MDKQELEADRAIDPSQLDVEAVRQAETYSKWAERQIIASTHVETLEFELSVLESELQIQARNVPVQQGCKAPTEASFKAWVAGHPKLREKTLAIIDAKREEGLLKTAASSLHMKKQMLELLGQLHGQQYFAGPGVPRNLMEAWAAHRRGVAEGANEKLRDGIRKRAKQGE